MSVECNQCLPSQECGDYHLYNGLFYCENIAQWIEAMSQVGNWREQLQKYMEVENGTSYSRTGSGTADEFPAQT